MCAKSLQSCPTLCDLMNHASDSLPCFLSVAKGFVLRQCGSDGQWGPWRDHSQCENPEKNAVFQVRRGEISGYDFQAAVEKQQPQTEPETPCTIQDSGFQVIEIHVRQPHLRCVETVGNPFQTTQGNRLSCRDQEGRRGSEEAVPGPSVFPSGEPGVSGQERS